ncbi:MAG: hypothetical protein ABIH00_09535 [Armatimonadota bacterium]
MAKGSPKKAGSPKCRGCGGLLEGKALAKISGKKWHKECAEKKGKKIPQEYNK